MFMGVNFVFYYSAMSRQASYGVIRKSDNVQRTCQIKWLDSELNECERQVSVYDIGEHPDFSFKVGDIVMRLVDVKDAKNEGSANNKALPTYGQVFLYII